MVISLMLNVFPTHTSDNYKVHVGNIKNHTFLHAYGKQLGFDSFYQRNLPIAVLSHTVAIALYVEQKTHGKVVD